MIYAPLLRAKLDENSNMEAAILPEPPQVEGVDDTSSILSVDSSQSEPTGEMNNSPRSTTRYSYMQAVNNGSNKPSSYF